MGGTADMELGQRDLIRAAPTATTARDTMTGLQLVLDDETKDLPDLPTSF